MAEGTSSEKQTKSVFPLWLQIVVGLVVGCLIGLLWPEFGKTLQPIGTAFIKAIKMIVIPLIFAAVTLGLAQLGADIKQLGRLGAIAFIWFYVATGISIAIGISLNFIFHPAEGIVLDTGGAVVPATIATSIDWVKFFLDIIPSNVIQAAAQQQIIPVLFFSVCLGLSLGSLGEKGRPFLNMLESLLAGMFKITKGIVATAPVAVAGILAWVVASEGSKLLLAMAKLIGVLYIGLFVVMVLFWILLVFMGIPPFKTTRKIMEPLLLAFTTASSEVTLPVHMDILQRNGVPKKIVSFIMPLGYSFNLDGAALYQALAVTFLAEAYGMHLDVQAVLTILLTTLVANKGTANVPGASVVVLAVLCQSLGLPMEAIAILAAIDRFGDMGRTAINVFGNTIAVLLVTKVSSRFGDDFTEDEEGGHGHGSPDVAPKAPLVDSVVSPV